MIRTRLALYGSVAILCALVFAAHQAGSDDTAGAAMFHGQTREKLLAAAMVSDGKVASIYMRWRMSCTSGRSYVSTIRFGAPYGDEFTYSGREFSFMGTDRQRPRAGATTYYRVHISGRISADGRTITGHGRTLETELRGARAVDRCRSEDVPWTVHRGVPVNRSGA